MKILISNDDGINSKGLIAIAEKLSKNNEVLVVAPDGNRSAISHSLTIGRPIKINKVYISDNFTSYAISGTPADCVKMANILMPDFKADIVVAGINKGHNIGSDILYSGTVAIACEASFFNNISFALSTSEPINPLERKISTCSSNVLNTLLLLILSPILIIA